MRGIFTKKEKNTAVRSIMERKNRVCNRHSNRCGSFGARNPPSRLNRNTAIPVSAMESEIWRSEEAGCVRESRWLKLLRL